MTDSRKIRHAHQLIEDIIEGYEPTLNDMETLRSFLPEKPKQKTLEDIIEDVRQVWGATAANAWPEDTHGILEVWLWELHNQLEGLSSSSPKPSQHTPGVPKGMRLATHPLHGLCVVSPNTDDEGDRRIFYLSGNVQAGADSRWVSANVHTFVDSKPPEPDYPEFLDCEEDYELAPEGTIVVYKKSVPFVKWGGTWRTLMHEDVTPAAEMGTIRRSVLRWGFGDE